MKCFLCAAAILALGSLAGCGAGALFQSEFSKKSGLPESPDVASAPWPRLVDTPAAPPKGQYGPGVPDPAEGTAVQVQLSMAAREAAARAKALEAPPLTPQDQARLNH